MCVLFYFIQTVDMQSFFKKSFNRNIGKLFTKKLLFVRANAVVASYIVCSTKQRKYERERDANEVVPSM